MLDAVQNISFLGFEIDSVIRQNAQIKGLLEKKD